MTRSKQSAMRWYGWAVVTRKGRLCIRSMNNALAIYRHRDEAEADCAAGQRPMRVAIRELVKR